MADTKITDLTTATTYASASWIPIVDTTVTTMASSGTDLKISPANLLTGMLPSQTGNSGKVLSTDGANNLSWSSSAGGAPTTATYILQTANGSLANAQALGALSTGILKSTTTTGVLSIAAGADIPAAGSSGNLQYNNSGVLGGSSLSGLIDTAFGATRGSILYRGASGWVELTPGTSGYFLQSQGAGADPTYASALSGTSNADPIYTIRSAMTAVTGTSPATLLTGGVSSGSLTIAANRLVAGSIIRIEIAGSIDAVSGDTLTLTIKLGSATILTATSSAAGSTLTGRHWTIDSTNFDVQTGGASGAGRGQGRYAAAGATAGSTLFAFYLSTGGSGASSLSATGFDCTGSLALDIQANFSSSSSSNSISARSGGIYING